MKLPISVYVEMTPNPNTYKFVCDWYLLSEQAEPSEYKNTADCENSSDLAKSLFGFPFVQSVFIADNFVAITQNGYVEWLSVQNELRSFIQNFLSTQEYAVLQTVQAKTAEPTEKNTEKIDLPPSDYDTAILHLLDEFVRPAVARDGGAIDFVGFDAETGTVHLQMRGACDGCPSASMTLKDGIERLLKSKLDKVQSVVSV
jgi:Fe-S cluster biogenesis protein NfuA